MFWDSTFHLTNLLLTLVSLAYLLIFFRTFLGLVPPNLIFKHEPSCLRTRVEARGRAVGVPSLPLPRELWRLNSTQEVWWQASLPTEPFHRSPNPHIFTLLSPRVCYNSQCLQLSTCFVLHYFYKKYSYKIIEHYSYKEICKTEVGFLL